MSPLYKAKPYKIKKANDSEWKLVTKIKGNSHERGGVQIQIRDKGRIHFRKGDSFVHAKYGLSIPSDDKPVKSTKNKKRTIPVYGGTKSEKLFDDREEYPSLSGKYTIVASDDDPRYKAYLDSLGAYQHWLDMDKFPERIVEEVNNEGAGWKWKNKDDEKEYNYLKENRETIIENKMNEYHKSEEYLNLPDSLKRKKTEDFYHKIDDDIYYRSEYLQNKSAYYDNGNEIVETTEIVPNKDLYETKKEAAQHRVNGVLPYAIATVPPYYNFKHEKEDNVTFKTRAHDVDTQFGDGLKDDDGGEWVKTNLDKTMDVILDNIINPLDESITNANRKILYGDRPNKYAPMYKKPVMRYEVKNVNDFFDDYDEGLQHDKTASNKPKTPNNYTSNIGGHYFIPGSKAEENAIKQKKLVDSGFDIKIDGAWGKESQTAFNEYNEKLNKETKDNASTVKSSMLSPKEDKDLNFVKRINDPNQQVIDNVDEHESNDEKDATKYMKVNYGTGDIKIPEEEYNKLVEKHGSNSRDLIDAVINYKGK